MVVRRLDLAEESAPPLANRTMKRTLNDAARVKFIEVTAQIVSAAAVHPLDNEGMKALIATVYNEIVARYLDEAVNTYELADR